jgi:hypothetical protein
MKGQERIDQAEELAAEAPKPSAQEDGRDTTSAGQEWPEIPAPGIAPPGVSKSRLPGVGPLPGS